jgi:hypothetical protein
MDCYVLVMYNHKNCVDQLESFVILEGDSKEAAGKYIRKNILELYDFFVEVSCNVKDMPDDSTLSDVEKAVFKANRKYGRKFVPKYKKKLIKEIKNGLAELSGEEIIDGFRSCNRKLLDEEATFLANKFEDDGLFYSESKVIPPHKIIEITHFNRILGKNAIIFQANIPVENLLPD